MDLNALTGTTQTSSAQSQNAPLRGLDLDQFLKLMITEMQNQDPLNPLENHQILQQLSQIREIEATDRLTTTLESMLLNQQLSSAGGLMNQNIRGLTDDGQFVVGAVDRVTISGGKALLHVGGQQVRLTNVAEILGDTDATIDDLEQLQELIDDDAT